MSLFVYFVLMEFTFGCQTFRLSFDFIQLLGVNGWQENECNYMYAEQTHASGKRIDKSNRGSSC